MGLQVVGVRVTVRVTVGVKVGVKVGDGVEVTTTTVLHPGGDVRVVVGGVAVGTPDLVNEKSTGLTKGRPFERLSYPAAPAPRPVT